MRLGNFSDLVPASCACVCGCIKGSILNWLCTYYVCDNISRYPRQKTRADCDKRKNIGLNPDPRSQLSFINRLPIHKHRCWHNRPSLGSPLHPTIILKLQIHLFFLSWYALVDFWYREGTLDNSDRAAQSCSLGIMDNKFAAGKQSCTKTGRVTVGQYWYQRW